MDKTFFLLALVFMGGVVLSLVLGVTAMSRGTPKSHKVSQKMMRMRVLCQGLAVMFLLLAYLTKR
ncbi:MAG: HIG1 domain-containing protein [Proteobacteria bacterium]|nr:HIG1 domain-containing protein [Pseudomonadota bacterium]